jgi:hypothetical protein
MGRLVRKPQVPDLDSLAAGLKSAQSGLVSLQMIKPDPGDGYLERLVKQQPQELTTPELLPEVAATERPRLVDVLAG